VGWGGVGWGLGGVWVGWGGEGGFGGHLECRAEREAFSFLGSEPGSKAARSTNPSFMQSFHVLYDKYMPACFATTPYTSSCTNEYEGPRI
jgi:hypothetical protein